MAHWGYRAAVGGGEGALGPEPIASWACSPLLRLPWERQLAWLWV